MKLYTHPMSSFSRRIRMQLHEKNVRIDEVTLDMAKREHKSEGYRGLNPYTRVPTLVDGDFVLYESSAIMEYLESVFPSPRLIPEGAQARALSAMHIKLCDLELSSHTRTLFFPRRFVPPERWNREQQSAAIDMIAKHLAVLDRQLEGKRFLVGESYGLVEIAYTPFLELLPLIELSAPPNVARWSAELSARPCAVATRPADYRAPG